jgi:succinate dehydrogenase/fumarate reductase cytochrome b subunit
MDFNGYTGFGGLIVLVLDLWAIVSIIGSGSSTGKKVLWVLLVLFLPIIGFIIWLLAGPRAAQGHS